jgi:glycosyltransferase involved in cell wall biosynthesis
MVMGDPPAGLVAKAGDPNSLADAIIRILADPELALSLRKRGFEQAEKYSWENLAKKMEAIYYNAVIGKYGNTI